MATYYLDKTIGYRNLYRSVFKPETSVFGVLHRFFGLYKNCHTKKWGYYDENNKCFVNYPTKPAGPDGRGDEPR